MVVHEKATNQMTVEFKLLQDLRLLGAILAGDFLNMFVKIGPFFMQVLVFLFGCCLASLLC